MITFYGYDRCSTCRKAQQWLREHGIASTPVDITTNPPPKRVLEAILRSGRYQLGELFNRSGEAYRALGLSQRLKTLTQAQALELLADNGRLVKRPIITDGSRHTVGFDPRRLAEVWTAPD